MQKKALVQHNGIQFEWQFFHFSESLTFHLKWKYDWHSGKIFVRFDIFFMFWTNIDECIFPHIIESGRIQLSVFANVVYTYLCSHSLPSIHTFFFIKSSSSSVHISFFPLYLFLNEKTNLFTTKKKKNTKNTHLTCNYTCDTFYDIVYMVFCCAFLRFSLLTVRLPQLTL